MEKPQREKILRNLPELIDVTVCTTIFLSIFLSESLFSLEDVEIIELEGKNNGRRKMSKIFYDILMTRKNAYAILEQALKQTNQTGVLIILSQPLYDKTINNDGRAKTSKFNEVQEFLINFLRDPSQTKLIIRSSDCQLTCERITDKVQNSKLLSNAEMLDYCSSVRNDNVFPVVSCELNLVPTLALLENLNIKMALVTSKSCSLRGIMDSTISIQSDDIFWQDLSPVCKSMVQKSLMDLTGVSTAESLIILQTIEEAALIQLINQEIPFMFQNTIPNSISYYIPRTLITRNVLTDKIFILGENEDILLFTNIERHELSQKLKENGIKTIGTEVSSNVIERAGDITIKFVICEQENHYEKIKKLYNNFNVHLIHYENRMFLWKKSSGSIYKIQDAVKSEQNSISQAQFIQETLSSTHNQTVIISDTPGMGKSELLINIAGQLKAKTKTGIVALIQIGELVERIKMFNFVDDFGEAVFSALKTFVCVNSLSEVCLKQRHSLFKELLLDAFDELNAGDIPFGYKCIKHIKETFVGTRLWLTTRPHMLLALEDIVESLGYNIASFREEDQLTFLKLYWSRNPKSNLQLSKLEIFGSKCLRLLKATIDDKHEGFAGVPLQCLLIGTVYDDEATEFACLHHSDGVVFPLFRASSIADLYAELIRQKLAKFGRQYQGITVNETYLMEHHYFYSIWLLFPEIRSEFKFSVNTDSSPPKEIFDVGIIEPTPVLYNSVPRFIHRTFAEYFVAEYVVKSIHMTINDQAVNLLFKHILKTATTTVEITDVKITTSVFERSVICYFINAFLKKSLQIPEKFYEQIKALCSFRLTKLSEACVVGKFENLFSNILVYLPKFQEYESSIFREKFVLITTYFCDKSMVVNVYEKYKKLSKKNVQSIEYDSKTLLHVAASRGNYSIVEHLLTNEDFYEIFSSNNTQIIRYYQSPRVFYDLANNSKFENDRTIEEKCKIFKYLFYLNETICNEDIVLNETVHHKLLLEIICNRTLTKYTTTGLLYQCVRQFTCSYFKQVLIAMERRNPDFSLKNFCSVGVLVSTFLKCWDQDENMLNMLKYCESVYMCDLEKTNEVFTSAILHQNITPETIISLLECMQLSEEQLLIAFWDSQVEHFYDYTPYKFFQVVIEEGIISPNLLNERGQTTLHCVVKNDRAKHAKSQHQYVKTLFKYGINPEIQDKTGKIAVNYFLEGRPELEKFKTLDIFLKESSPTVRSCFKWTWILDSNKDEKLEFQTDKDNFNRLADICLIERGCSCARNESGNTFFHIAAIYNSAYAFKYLIKKQLEDNLPEKCKVINHLSSNTTDLNEKKAGNQDTSITYDNSDDQTSTNGHDIINASNHEQETALNILMKQEILNYDAIKMLIDAGADPTLRGSNGLHCIDKLCCGTQKDANMLKYILNFVKVNSILVTEDTLMSSFWCCNEYSIQILCDWCVKQLNISIRDMKGLYMKDMVTPLDLAVFKENPAVLDYLIKIKGCRAMCQPFGFDWIDKLVEQDIEQSILLEICSIHEGSAEYLLHYAVGKNLIALVEGVLESTNVSVKNEDIITTLLVSAVKEFPIPTEICKLLISKGADPWAADDTFKNSVEYLCETNDPTDLLLYILERSNLSTETTEMTLLIVFRHTNIKCIESVCDWYTKRNKKPLKDIKGTYKQVMFTVIDVVLQRHDEQVLLYFLEKHECFDFIKINIADHWAEHLVKKYLENCPNKQMAKFVQMLDIEIQVTSTTDALDPLCKYGLKPDLIENFICLGANINEADSRGYTPLHWALKHDQWNVNVVVEFLIKNGADVNLETSNEDTPIALALKLEGHMRIECLKLLLDNGADARKPDLSWKSIFYHLPPRLWPNHFHNLVELFITRGLLDLLQAPGYSNLNIFEKARRLFRLQKRTLNLLKKHNVQI